MRIVRRRFGKPLCARCGKELLPLGRVNGYPCNQCPQCGLVVTAGGKQYHEPKQKGVKTSGGRGIYSSQTEADDTPASKGILFPDYPDREGEASQPSQQ